MNINNEDKELVRLALELIKKRKGEFTFVGCALKTTNGKIYTGVSIEQKHSSPCGMCAEFTTIGKMHSDNDQEIESIVAITFDEKILPPCGQCRELIRQFGNPYVMLKKNNEFFKIKLDELIPYWEM